MSRIVLVWTARFTFGVAGAFLAASIAEMFGAPALKPGWQYMMLAWLAVSGLFSIAATLAKLSSQSLIDGE